MPSIIEGFRKIYKAPNASKVHLIYAGVIVLLGAVSFFAQTSKNIIALLLSVILSLVWVIYVYGYKLQFMHNAFQEEFLMPGIDTSPFKAFGGAFGLIVVWFGYYMVYSIIMAIIGIIIPLTIFITKNPILAILLLTVLTVVMCLIILFIPYVFVAYSKDFNTAGLFNMLIPFKFMRKAFVDNLILWLKCIPFVIVFALMVLVAWQAAGILDGIIQTFHGIPPAAPDLQVNYTPKFMALSAVMGYMAFVFSLAYVNYLVQIYKEKIE